MSWPDEPIQKDFTLVNLAYLLEEGLRGSMSSLSHYHIVQWCGEFCLHHSQSRLPKGIKAAVSAADELVVQWELYVGAQFTLEQLQRFDLNDLVLPKAAFEASKALLDGE